MTFKRREAIMYELTSICILLTFVSGFHCSRDNTVTTLEVERFSHLVKDGKLLFNDKGSDYVNLIHNTLRELYLLDPNGTTYQEIRKIIDKHRGKCAFINHAFDDDLQKLLQPLPIKPSRKRGFWGSIGNFFKNAVTKTADFLSDHSDEISDAMEIMQIFAEGKRQILHPSEIIQRGTHHLNAAKVKVDLHVSSVTIFLDNQLQLLRDHLDADPHVVGVPNRFTGSLTSAN